MALLTKNKKVYWHLIKELGMENQPFVRYSINFDYNMGLFYYKANNRI